MNEQMSREISTFMSEEEIREMEHAKPKLEDQRKKFFFWAYNDIMGRGLSPSSISIYVLFCIMSGNSRKDIWPSYEYITEQTTIKSKATIKKALEELQELDLIKIVARYSKHGGRISNLYQIKNKLEKKGD